jgi:tetratricopeptide (TPR) repeat protein
VTADPQDHTLVRPSHAGGPENVALAGVSYDDSTLEQIAGDQVNLYLEPPPIRAPGRVTVPADTTAFAGRQTEITAILTAAREGGHLAVIRAIDGMPGVGKTALAIHAGRLLADEFPDRQLFVDLHGHTSGRSPKEPATALAELLRADGVVPRYLPADLDDRAAMWRDRMAHKRVLLILDNAASSQQVLPLLPGHARSLVLVTSRQFLGDLPADAVEIPLDILPPEEARSMFIELAPRSAGQPDRVTELVALAGHLPLAIALLAGLFTQHTTWHIDDLITQTRAHVLTVTAESRTIAAAFELSYQSLPWERQRFFRCLGLCPGADFDSYSAAALADLPPGEAATHLNALLRDRLVMESRPGRYRMHDLIRSYAQDRAAQDPAADRERAQERLLDYYQQAATIAETRLARKARTKLASTAPAPPSATVPALPPLRDNREALAWARVERGNLLACLDYAARAGQRARVVSLSAGLGALLRQDGPWTETSALHETAVRAARQLGDRPGEANALHELGVVRRLAADYPAAARALDAALDIYRDLDDRLGQANALHEVGALRCYTGDYLDAAKALCAALDIFRDLDDRLGQVNALNQLGVQQYLTGDYPGAIETLAEALKISQGTADKLGQAHALNQLGVVRRQRGDYSAAAEALDAALSLYRDIDDRLGQANALNELGMVRRQTGDYQAAAEVLELALGICAALGYRRGQANALMDLGAVRRQTGDYSAAADALDAALGIYRDIGDRGGEVEGLNEAGALHRIRGELDRAAEHHRQALHLAREIHSSWDEAHALAGLGRCAQAAGRTAEARVNLRHAQEIFQQLGVVEAAGVSAEIDALG